jgi:hypothetical protein
VLLCLVAAGAGGCRGRGCGAGGRRAEAAAVLAKLPQETEVVIGVDLARLRRAPLWPRVASLAGADPADSRLMEEFARSTGLDPRSQIDALLVAFPAEARQRGEIAVRVRARGLDQARLLAYVRDQAAREGDDLFSFQHAGQTLWATRRQPATAGFFVGADTVIVGAGGWAEKLAERVGAPGSGGGAAENAALLHLVERVDPERAVWAAAIVPAATRAELGGRPDFAPAAGISRLGVSLDLGADLEARLIADLAATDQARELARRVEAAVADAKRSPQALLLGVVPHLEGVRARADGASCEIVAKVPSAEVMALATRLKTFLDLARRGPP